MPRRKNPPPEPFRPSQVVYPVPSDRRYRTTKSETKAFDVYVGDLETGEETLAITIYAPTPREAIQMYDLRHTAATISLIAGVSPKIISEQLRGPSSRTMRDGWHPRPAIRICIHAERQSSASGLSPYCSVRCSAGHAAFAVRDGCRTTLQERKFRILPGN
jgi:hypothetical protein